MSLNKVMLIGDVGNDPEIRYLDNGPAQQGPANTTKVATFRFATTERYRDRNGETRENTEWHSIVAWRSNADFVEKFVHKGSQLFIEGKLRTRQWTDQQGNKRFTTEVQADNIQLLGKRPDGQSDCGPQGGPAVQPGNGQVAGGRGPAEQAQAVPTGTGTPGGSPQGAPGTPPDAPVPEPQGAPGEGGVDDDLPF